MKQAIRFGIVGYGVQGAFYASVLRGQGGVPRPAGCTLAAISTTSPRKMADLRDIVPGCGFMGTGRK